MLVDMISGEQQSDLLAELARHASKYYYTYYCYSPAGGARCVAKSANTVYLHHEATLISSSTD